jgi:dCTP deaminase
MILSDSAILQAIEDNSIGIEPFDIKCLGSNSYDLHLSKHIAWYDDHVLDAKKDNPITHMVMDEEGQTLYPNQLYLASTVESTYAKDTVPMIEGKSSIARLGIQIHLTAGFGDVGFLGHWTLEISVIEEVIVYPNMPIAQIYFQGVKGIVNKPYHKKKDAKYSEQGALPVGSKMYKNFQ